MPFSHPLARAAEVWPAEVTGGQTLQILVVVTTLELDHTSERYNPEMVERLSSAAQEFVQRTDKIHGFLFASRATDWEGSLM